jgi:hypothetical protein
VLTLAVFEVAVYKLGLHRRTDFVVPGPLNPQRGSLDTTRCASRRHLL